MCGGVGVELLHAAAVKTAMAARTFKCLSRKTTIVYRGTWPRRRSSTLTVQSTFADSIVR